jgi:hypothetical protein
MKEKLKHINIQQICKKNRYYERVSECERESECMSERV